MEKIPQNILDLSAEGARCFFLKHDSYCNIGLPNYFNFQPLLEQLFSKIEKKELSYFTKTKPLWLKSPEAFQDVNYHFFQNKDGQFSWRPLQIIHPVVYVCLVKEITQEDNWNIIKDRFKEFKSDSIICHSLPPVNLTTRTDTANTVLGWWKNVEQKSLEFAMEYKYLMTTDIADCYSSMYTHAITWAMCGRKNSKYLRKKDDREKIANVNTTIIKRYSMGDCIDYLIRSMSFSQTNGIPQGSVLMDFIAELVLGYADKKLYQRLSVDLADKDYKILRYRDDYRIFGKTQEQVVQIAKILTEVLSDLNFRLNSQKTVLTQDMISGALKPDKLYYITHDYKRLEEPENGYTLQKHLLRLYKLSKEYPNTGSLQKAMNRFYRRICDWKELDLFKEIGAAKVLVSIATDIAYNNPKVYREYAAIVSKILSFEPNHEEKEELINQILEKFRQLPNVGFLEIWLQRLTIKDCRSRMFEEKLCRYVANEDVSIWNLDWLASGIKDIFNDVSFIGEDQIQNLSNYIEYREIEKFGKY